MALNQTRIVRVAIGDSLRTLALRELGDALRWVEIAELNELRPPYIVESVNPADRVRGTVIFGDPIRVPVGRVERVSQTAEDVLGIDVALRHGEIEIGAGGDYGRVVGVSNLNQALMHRVKTALGELITHPRYGCNAHVAIGMKLRSLSVIMLAGYVRRAIMDEPRVARINKLAPRVLGDAIHVYANVTPVAENTPFDLNFVFPMGR